MSDFLKHALALAGYGYRVFPLEVNGKRPALASNWKTLATTDPENIRSMWTSSSGEILDYNIGIATGDGLIVVDIDVKDGVPLGQRVMVLEMMTADMPDTYYVDTTSGGRHYYLMVDPDLHIPNSVKRVSDGVDIKSDNGYVVGRGSVIDGKQYAAKGNPLRIAAAPAALVAACAAKPRKSTANPSDAPILAEDELDSESAIQRAKAWLRDSAPYHGTYAVAARVKDFGISEQMNVELVDRDWNEARGLGKALDHIAFRVGNAYRYGQSAVGIAAPEAEFEPVEVEDRRTKPAKGKLYYERWRDVGFSADSVSLIDGWYDRGAMVVTYGESGSGKTHIVLSQSVAIATGEKWCESETTAGLVVYVAAEGGRGIRKRIAAWRRKMGDADIPVALVPCPVDLMRPTGDTDALIGLIKAAEADFGCQVVMVVIDTASRAMAGGNENAPDDMGAFVMHCDRIRDATKATLHVIHHSGKNKAAGARGHSLLRAATDTEIEVSEGKVTATKQRDMDTPKAINFTLQGVDLGTDDRGRRVTTALPVLAIESEFEEKVSEGQERQFDSLWALIEAKTGSDEVDAICAAEANMSDWKAAHGIPRGDRSGAAKEFERNADALVRAGRITISESGRGKSTVFKVNRTFAESRQKSATN